MQPLNTKNGAVWLARKRHLHSTVLPWTFAQHLHAILDIPKDSTHPLRLHHPSFRDFLLDEKRCEDLKLGIIEKQANENLATNCIRLMCDSLKQDTLGKYRSGALVADVETSRVEQCLPPELHTRYKTYSIINTPSQQLLDNHLKWDRRELSAHSLQL
jgi:hypothetical protein